MYGAASKRCDVAATLGEDFRMQNFRRLKVWERAHALALEIRRELHALPPGYAALKSQLISAAEAISANIAEGAAAATPKEFARVLDISIKSTSEVENHLQLASDYGIIRQDRWRELSDEVVQLRRMLVVLRRRVLERAEKAVPDDQTENCQLKTENS